MMNEGALKPGQIIQLPGDRVLWRVDHVNECRAYIFPLGKHSEGQNIAPTSLVQIVDDVARAREEAELEAVEAEILEMKRALDAPVAAVPVPVRPVPRPKHGKREPVRPGGGWHMVSPGSFKEGTLAEAVMMFIVANPGRSTAEIVAGVQEEGAVAACVSRFNQAGLIEKR
jgi:hypothetical protein